MESEDKDVEPEEDKPKKNQKDGKIKKDRFGFREGTKSSRVCTCLSEVPKSMKQLMEESGVPLEAADSNAVAVVVDEAEEV